ncbi:hypothetical protein MY3296_002138 [Beauveria thailandica]
MAASDVLLYFNHGRVERVKLKRNYPSFLDGEDLAERNNTGGPRHIPGIHVAINFERHPNIQFSHGFGLWKQERLTLAELAMLRLMNDLTEEENWQSKVFDFSVVQRWKALALSRYFTNHELWDWCLFELMNKAKEHDWSRSILALDSASRIYKSDRLKNTQLLRNLLDNTGRRSISPWLYPFIYAGSPIRADGRAVNLENITSSIGGGIIPPRPFWDNDKWSGEMQYYSSKSQWLAADITFTGQGNVVSFLSPINNLHPLRHKPLYSAMENLITESIPQWNKVLLYKSLQRNGPRIKSQERRRCDACLGTTNRTCFCAIELSSFSRWIQGGISTGTEEPPPGSDWSPTSALNGNYTNVKRLYDSISLSKGFKDRGLQVYIELAHVEIDADGNIPDEDLRRFEWGLNGNRNERIVATSLICLRRENIKEQSGRISFRSEIKNHGGRGEAAAEREQPSSSIPTAVSGNPLAPQFQELVSIRLPEGRVVTFPNALQHKFEQLDLDDESKCGRLQFLAIHLVDPHYRLCSTRHVPPQSVSWWWEAARLGFVCWQHKAPLEIKNLIVDFAIGEGCGHSIQQAEDCEDASAGSNPGLRFAPDNSPEQVQEEKPIRIEAATRMRQKAMAEHGTVIRALNRSRVYGVPSRLRVWYRQNCSTSVPLDYSEPEELGTAAVNSVVKSNGDLVWAPEDGEDSDDEDSDDEEDGALPGSAAQNNQTEQPDDQTQVVQMQVNHAQPFLLANTQIQNHMAPSHQAPSNQAEDHFASTVSASSYQMPVSQEQTGQEQNDELNGQFEDEQGDPEQFESEDDAQEQILEQLYTEQLHASRLRLQAQVRGAPSDGESLPLQPREIPERPLNGESTGSDSNSRKRHSVSERHGTVEKMRRRE